MAEQYPVSARPGSPEPLGVTVVDGGVNVAVYAPKASSLFFCVFDESGNESRIQIIERHRGVFHGFVPGVDPGSEYGLRADGSWDPANGQRFNVNKLLVDPYARAVTGDLSLNEATLGQMPDNDLERQDDDSASFVPRSVVVGHDDFDWGDEVPMRTPLAESVIYEVHTKGFTKLHPAIPEAIRGTYAGLAHPLAVEHLTKLGVTAVELLPVHQFVNEAHLQKLELTNYWGYNTLAFFAPHNGYSSSGDHGEQITEFKVMVKALHAAGIEVILDVVFNHTAEVEEIGSTLNFRGLANEEYYHLTDGGRHYLNVTGCGNSVNAAKPATLRLIFDSLRYWTQEFHIDGFRFDLAPELTRSIDTNIDMLGAFMSAVAADPILRNVKLIAEPWDIGADGYQIGNFPTQWNEWNGKFRDGLRDFWRSAGSMSETGKRLSGSQDLYGSREPAASVNFITAHDGYTMRDLVSYEQKHNLANGENNNDGSGDNRSWNSGVEGETDDPGIRELRIRRIKSMLATLILSAGTPMLMAGDEMGRTQCGNNNAYCQDTDIAWVDWELADWQNELFEFTCALVSLRREHRAFSRRGFFTGNPVGNSALPDLVWIGPNGVPFTDAEWNDPGVHPIAFFLNGDIGERDADGQQIIDDSFLILLNPTNDESEFTLPGPQYAAAFQVALSFQEVLPGASPASHQPSEQVTLKPFASLVFKAT